MASLARASRWIVVVSLVWSAMGEAQTVSGATERSLNPSLVLYDVSRSLSQTSKGAIGLTATVGRSIGPLVRARLAVSAWASLPGGDVVSPCYLLPDDTCAPDPVVPEVLVMGEFQGVARILPLLPLFALGGIGVALPQGPRADSLPSTRPLFRAGLEFFDGRRGRGLRFHFSRVFFHDGVRDLRSASVFGLGFRI